MRKAGAFWPEMVAFDVTTRCNLRCAHCYNDSGAGERGDMGREELLDVAGQIARLRPFNVCLCGGEPLCCPWLLEIVDVLRPAAGRVCMVTNGYAMTEELARTLAARGLDAVQVSLDGAYAWQHDSLRGVGGSFARAVAALRSLKRAGVGQVAVSILPNRLNQYSLDEYARLCLDLGVDIVRSMPFLPSGRGRTVGRDLMLDENEAFAFCRGLRRIQLACGERLRVEWSDPLSHLLAMPARARAGLPNLDMEIRANGDLAVSTYLPIVVGNCLEHDLADYWRAGYQSIWRDARLTDWTNRVRNVNDLDSFDPPPYSGANLEIDLWEDTHEISH